MLSQILWQNTAVGSTIRGHWKLSQLFFWESYVCSWHLHMCLTSSSDMSKWLNMVHESCMLNCFYWDSDQYFFIHSCRSHAKMRARWSKNLGQLYECSSTSGNSGETDLNTNGICSVTQWTGCYIQLIRHGQWYNADISSQCYCFEWQWSFFGCFDRSRKGWWLYRRVSSSHFGQCSPRWNSKRVSIYTHVTRIWVFTHYFHTLFVLVL